MPASLQCSFLVRLQLIFYRRSRGGFAEERRETFQSNTVAFSFSLRFLRSDKGLPGERRGIMKKQSHFLY